MKEIDITAEELKKEIYNYDPIGSGFFGTTFLYKGELIKMDRILYHLLKINEHEPAKITIDRHYNYGKGRPLPTDDLDDFKMLDGFAEIEQIRELASRRKDITLTKLPEGVLRVDGRVLGVILPYHKNHQSLEHLSPMEHEVLIEVLKKLRLAIMELADNKISQNDLYQIPDKNVVTYNILYQGNTPQIIDLEGPKVRFGKKFTDAKEMYNQLAFIILDYFRKNHLDTNVNYQDINDEHQAKELIEEFEHRIRGK